MSPMSNESAGPGTVVVAADGSEHGLRAVRYAAREAARVAAPLTIVHVLPEKWMGTTQIPDDPFRSLGTEFLERAKESALTTVPGLRVSTQLRAGAADTEILAISDQACLVVLGSHGPSSFDRIWTGGTVSGVVSRASAPVVVVPPSSESTPPWRRVVVGFKSSAHAPELFDEGFRLADQLDAELVVLHAWRLPGVYDDMIADRVEKEPWNREQTELIEKALAAYRDVYPKVRVLTSVRHESPVHALVRASRRADRLLILRPTRGALVHHLDRTVRAVLREAHCPVQVVPSALVGESPGPPLVVESSGKLLR